MSAVDKNIGLHGYLALQNELNTHCQWLTIGALQNLNNCKALHTDMF